VTSIVPRYQLNIGSIYGLLGLLIAFIVHAATFTSFSLNPNHPLVWILHIGIFPLFVSMIFRLQYWVEMRRGPFGLPMSRLRWQELRAFFPAWAVALEPILTLYVMITLFLTISHVSTSSHVNLGAMQAANPEIARYTVRAFSANWLIFYAVPALYYLFVPLSAVPSDSTRQPAG
jgi:hypothetical protein